jgi:NAD(P)-dependent dehydrogenase (short-subunit alcohol dehydrogenase family)
VLLSYASGREDAEKVTGEIGDWGGSCRAIRYDASAEPGPQLVEGGVGDVTHCYYFATPPIFGASAGAYDKTRFDRFRAVYVDGFAALCDALAGGGKTGIYYPSSVAVAERPSGMTEYAMAKAAGEILCEEIARARDNLDVLTTRLPRLATDQTATLIAGENADAVDILLPIVLRVQGAS